MKIKNLFIAMLAGATICACSNDDDSSLVNGNKFAGDEAYVTVRLTDVGSTKGIEGGLLYGTAAEHAVKTAHFYFYDANGAFVSEASVWTGGTESTTDPAENIEFRGNSVVVLNGLEGKNFPKYMVTILNKAADFEPASTLAEMEKAMATTTAGETGITVADGTTNYFTMSTTSYKQSGLEGKYFVTEVEEKNFSTEPVPENPVNPVIVYVERLAAKVTVNVAETLKNSAITLDDGSTLLYKVNTTVAGDLNEEDDDNNIGSEEVYVKFLGWKLNATAKSTYMMKNIDETWADNLMVDANGTVVAWNHSDYFRSYWASHTTMVATHTNIPMSLQMLHHWVKLVLLPTLTSKRISSSSVVSVIALKTQTQALSYQRTSPLQLPVSSLRLKYAT